MTDRSGEDPALHHTDEQFRRLVTEVKDYAIFMLDLHGYVQTWNEGARHIKGYSADEIVGQHFSTFYPTESVDERLPDQLLCEARVDGRTEHEGWRVRKDGSQFWAQVTIIHDDAGEIQGFAKVTRDLTERVRHERRLEQFAQAVSHDLRQPLRTLTIDLELLERRAGATLETDNEELLLESIDGAKRMQAMVNGLLEYVRLETVAQTTEAVECEAVVNDAIRDLAALIEERNADITVGSLPVVQVDREQLHVVFLNLLENAVKYTVDGPPEITVAAKQRTDGCQIAVSDTGMGIDPGKQEDIFKLFERSHRVRDTAGIGLGLALCKQIIEQHSGEIWVESTPGAGSTFYLTLPTEP